MAKLIKLHVKSERFIVVAETDIEELVVEKRQRFGQELVTPHTRRVASYLMRRLEHFVAEEYSQKIVGQRLNE